MFISKLKYDNRLATPRDSRPRTNGFYVLGGNRGVAYIYNDTRIVFWWKKIRKHHLEIQDWANAPRDEFWKKLNDSEFHRRTHDKAI